ncbi:iron chelate uptake ABC transporter family permease subunit, partial [Bacillus sp. D-CC]
KRVICGITRPTNPTDPAIEIAIGLGQNTTLIKFIGTVLVLVLTGSAVSMAGSVGFVGLVIPHMTRFLVGSDYRWVIPCSAVLGG